MYAANSMSTSIPFLICSISQRMPRQCLFRECPGSPAEFHSALTVRVPALRARMTSPESTPRQRPVDPATGQPQAAYFDQPEPHQRPKVQEGRTATPGQPGSATLAPQASISHLEVSQSHLQRRGRPTPLRAGSERTAEANKIPQDNI